MARSGGDDDDPLVGYSSLSSFPTFFNNTSSSSSSTHHLSNPNNSPVLDWLLSRVKTMALKSPLKFLKQAKDIDDDLGVSKIDKPSAMASEDKTEAVVAASEKNCHEKRPALGLKRAKFSVKPMPSQPAVSLEPSIDIDKLEDPEEFFAAFERMENAKKEMQKLRGQPLKDLDQNISSLPPRQRRPSLFGKSATYKHRSYSSNGMVDNGNAFLSSQESFEHQVHSPACQDVQRESNVNISPHVRISDSTPTVNSNVDELDELLSCDYDGLDDAGVLNLVQEKLQLKLIDIGKPSLPDLGDARQCEFETSSEALPKMRDTLSRLNGMKKTISNESLVLNSELMKSSVLPQKSPTLSASPLASLSLLKRRISRLSQSDDPFAIPDDVSSPSRIYCQKAKHTIESDQIDTRNGLYKSQGSSMLEEESTAVASPSPVLTVNGVAPSGEPKERLNEVSQSEPFGNERDFHNFRGSPAHGEHTAVAHGEKHTAVSGEDLPVLAGKDTALSNKPKEWVDELTQFDQVGKRKDSREFRRSPDIGEATLADSGVDSFVVVAEDVGHTNEPNDREAEVSQSDEVVTRKGLCELERSLAVGETTLANSGEDSVIAAKDLDPTCEPKEQEEEMSGAMDSIRKHLNFEGFCMEKSIINEVEVSGVGEPSNAEDICFEEPDKETAGSPKRKLKRGRKPKALSQTNTSEEIEEEGRNEEGQENATVLDETRNKRRKIVGAPQQSSKREALNRRQSLWEAGTKWEAGVRRSTRIRMRPLEHWKGERLLYGRVHESLVTVIGVKYATPSQPAAKVKSFVSDKYKDLVDLAAAH